MLLRRTDVSCSKALREIPAKEMESYFSSLPDNLCDSPLFYSLLLHCFAHLPSFLQQTFPGKMLIPDGEINTWS